MLNEKGTLTFGGRTFEVRLVGGYADPIEIPSDDGWRKYINGTVTYVVEVVKEQTPEEIATRIREAL